MSRPDTNQTGPHVAAQVTATWTALDAAARNEQLTETLQAQDRAFLEAQQKLQAVRNFVESPDHILGNPATKHGEIAEQVDVGVRRAVDILHGQSSTASFDGIGRLDPVDYRMDGVDIQSKYYDGLRNTLDGVSSHAAKYQNFASGDGRYHIPRDQHQQMEQLRQTSRADGLSDESVASIKSKLDTLQQETGRPPDEFIQPGEGTYAEVQKENVHDTILDRKNRLAQENDELKQAARIEHGPSLAGLENAAAIGAAAGGGVRLGQAIWVKCREGKNPFRGEFSTQDWKDIGVATVQGGAGGAVAGSALYALTNSTDLAAPFAASFVSSLMGVGDLLRQYHSGQIDGEQFVELSHIIAADAAIVGLSSAAGQVLIPVPILGALVGSLAGKIVAAAIKDGLGEAESELIARLEAYEKRALEKLDEEFRAFLEKLDAYFGSLERLAKVAFDNTVNTALRMEASIQFAEVVGVPEKLILRTTEDLDTLMKE